MKELDVLLGRFLSARADDLGRGAWPQFETLLEEEDDRLWDWLQGRAEPADAALGELVEALRRG